MRTESNTVDLRGLDFSDAKSTTLDFISDKLRCVASGAMTRSEAMINEQRFALRRVYFCERAMLTQSDRLQPDYKNASTSTNTAQQFQQQHRVHSARARGEARAGTQDESKGLAEEEGEGCER